MNTSLAIAPLVLVMAAGATSAWGFSPGSVDVPGCARLQADVEPYNGMNLTAGADGRVKFTKIMPDHVCGNLSIQAIARDTCLKSDVVTP